MCRIDHFLDLLAGRSDSLELDRAALLLARLEHPGLEIEPFVAMLDSYAVELQGRLGEHVRGLDYVEAADQYLFGELGFAGNSQNYYDPRNSCLNDVLTARTGIPITLAVVYMEIARRLGRPVYGIGLPGHFLVEYRDADFSVFIDVFHGGRLVAREDLPADPRLLAPVNKRQIVMRMLHNLRNVYLMRQAYGKAIETLDLALAANPDSIEDYKQRGILHAQKRNLSAARADLEAYLRLAPEASDREEIEKHLQALRQSLARLN